MRRGMWVGKWERGGGVTIGRRISGLGTKVIPVECLANRERSGLATLHPSDGKALQVP